MSGVGGVCRNISCMSQGPGGVQVLESWKIAASHLLSRANDTLRSALVLGSDSSVPHGDGGGEDGLDDGRLRISYGHQKRLSASLQPPWALHPLWSAQER